MAKQIGIVTMVKNEDDIIECFVRHHMGICDFMLVFDDGSIDNTRLILDKLAEEGLPIYFYAASEDKIGYQQEVIMNELAETAFETFGADLVLPMDADEFCVLSSPPPGIFVR